MNKKLITTIITTVVIATIGHYTMMMVNSALVDYQDNARREMRLRTRRRGRDFKTVC